MKRQVRVGVLASGRGSNFEALVRAHTAAATSAAASAWSTPTAAAGPDSDVQVQIACLATDRADAAALRIASEHAIPTRVVQETASRGRLQTAHEQALCDFLVEHRVDLVCLAGFMRIVRGPLLQRYRRAILNIHPSLLPSFPGLDAPRQALEHGVRLTGCTVHFVDAGIDTGPIVLQAAVPVFDEDDVETLTARIQQQEHRLYPQAVALWAADRVQVRNGRVFILGASTPTTGTPQAAGKEESS